MIPWIDNAIDKKEGIFGFRQDDFVIPPFIPGFFRCWVPLISIKFIKFGMGQSGREKSETKN
jgi:hypothetical protein